MPFTVTWTRWPSYKCNEDAYTVCAKKHAILVLGITSENVNWFSKLFHCRIQSKICLIVHHTSHMLLHYNTCEIIWITRNENNDDIEKKMWAYLKCINVVSAWIHNDITTDVHLTEPTESYYVHSCHISSTKLVNSTQQYLAIVDSDQCTQPAPRPTQPGHPLWLGPISTGCGLIALIVKIRLVAHWLMQTLYWQPWFCSKLQNGMPWLADKEKSTVTINRLYWCQS